MTSSVYVHPRATWHWYLYHEVVRENDHSRLINFGNGKRRWIPKRHHQLKDLAHGIKNIKMPYEYYVDIFFKSQSGRFKTFTYTSKRGQTDKAVEIYLKDVGWKWIPYSAMRQDALNKTVDVDTWLAKKW